MNQAPGTTVGRQVDNKIRRYVSKTACVAATN